MRDREGEGRAPLVAGVDAAPALETPLLARLESIFALTDDERAALKTLSTEPRVFRRGESVILENSPLDCLYIAQSGWFQASRSLADGRRQILTFSMPGDVIGFEAVVSQQSLRAVEALEPGTLLRLQTPDMIRFVREQPRLGIGLAWVAAQDESALAERLTSVGRRSAYEALAHLFLEHHHRLTRIGLADAGGYRFPGSKEQIADALGLTPMHVHRTLRRLAADGLVRVSGTRVEIGDRDRLIEIAQFTDGYLMDGDRAAPPEKAAD